MKKKDSWAVESEEDASNIGGRAVMELGTLARNQPESIAQKKGDNLLKF